MLSLPRSLLQIRTFALSEGVPPWENAESQPHVQPHDFYMIGKLAFCSLFDYFFGGPASNIFEQQCNTWVPINYMPFCLTCSILWSKQRRVSKCVEWHIFLMLATFVSIMWPRVGATSQRDLYRIATCCAIMSYPIV